MDRRNLIVKYKITEKTLKKKEMLLEIIMDSFCVVRKKPLIEISNIITSFYYLSVTQDSRSSIITKAQKVKDER